MMYRWITPKMSRSLGAAKTLRSVVSIANVFGFIQSLNRLVCRRALQTSMSDRSARLATICSSSNPSNVGTIASERA
jgi:hypothetical protein